MPQCHLINSGCHADQVCTVLDLASGLQNRCANLNAICSTATCVSGSCVAYIDQISQSTKVTCVSVPSSGSSQGSDGSVGSGIDAGGEAVQLLKLPFVASFRTEAHQIFVQSAVNSNGASLQLVLPNNSRCLEKLRIRIIKGFHLVFSANGSTILSKQMFCIFRK